MNRTYKLLAATVGIIAVAASACGLCMLSFFGSNQGTALKIQTNQRQIDAYRPKVVRARQYARRTLEQAEQRKAEFQAAIPTQTAEIAQLKTKTEALLNNTETLKKTFYAPTGLPVHTQNSR